jgi:hypothetical protein
LIHASFLRLKTILLMTNLSIILQLLSRVSQQANKDFSKENRRYL